MAVLGTLGTLGAIGAMSAARGVGNMLNAQNTESFGYSDESSSSQSSSSGFSQTFGTEASAADMFRAQEANALQDAYLQQQMMYNASEAEKARNWSKMMSDTSYQRAVADLKAAGLNPLLAVGASGASTPAAASATGGLQSAYKANTYADQISSSSSQSSSSSSGHSENQSKTNTQLNSAIETIGSTAKGIMEGLGSTINKIFKK